MSKDNIDISVNDDRITIRGEKKDRKRRMLSRDTHARIYQGEFSKREYEEILHLARQRNTSAQELILNAIAFYLKNGGYLNP